MKSRKDRLDNKCTHREYYAQFVDDYVIKTVKYCIGTKRILDSTDDSFNDIPLKEWDNVFCGIPSYIGNKIRETGTFPSLSDSVCICKEAAKQIKEGITTTK